MPHSIRDICWLVGVFIVVSQLTIFPLDLLGLAEKPMASLSSSKGKIVKWDTFQIIGSKHNCLLLPVIQADDQARLAPCICIVKYVNVVQLIDENDFWIMDKTKYFSLGVLGICLKKKRNFIWPVCRERAFCHWLGRHWSTVLLC